MKNIITSLLLILLVYVSASADDRQSDINNYDFNIITNSSHGNEKPEETIIEFVNISNNEVIKSINVLEDSPYYNLPFGMIIQEGWGAPYYYYSKMKVSDFLDNYDTIVPEIYAKYKDNNIFRPKLANRVIFNRNYIGVINHLIAFKSYEDSYGIKSTLTVYNRKGDIVLQLLDIFPGIEEIGMTADSKYLGFSFGSIGYIDLVNYTGIAIYDLHNGKEILNKEFPRSKVIKNLAVTEDLFLYSISQRDNFGNRLFTYNYIVPDKRTIYTAELPTSISNQIKRYSEDGLILHRKGGELYGFEENFKKEKF